MNTESIASKSQLVIKLSIVYGLVARQQNVLCGCTGRSSNSLALRLRNWRSTSLTWSSLKVMNSTFHVRQWYRIQMVHLSRHHDFHIFLIKFKQQAASTLWRSIIWRWACSWKSTATSYWRPCHECGKRWSESRYPLRSSSTISARYGCLDFNTTCAYFIFDMLTVHYTI